MVFREGRREDVPAVVALIANDFLGKTREHSDMEAYLAAYDAMCAEGANLLIVGEEDGAVVATYQITFISGLSLSAARRAQVEAVRVADSLRGRGMGRAMFEDAERRAREAGCSLMQLTMNAQRTESRKFYETLGFEASHVGFKKRLD
ncbi:N-acetyltransferase family protein [Pseudoruegeria sp. HB172150]|uniref:GNAT family N-acetyltransferase n=1 Tax=Pseudoruegeria sp. HB172150 TaxID=2721164 RepID=UPI00352F097F